jgi:hypothetical protein
LWEEKVKFDESSISDEEERKSLNHCKRSDYKYYIHFVGGLNYTFTQFINKDNAVRNININIKYKIL